MALPIMLVDIIQGKQDICCLCLRAVPPDAIRIQDEIVLKGREEPLELFCILELILDSEVMSMLSPRNFLCNDCQILSVCCYHFIRMCKENTDHLNSVVNYLTESLSFVKDTDDCQSLFMTIDGSTLSSSSLIYDYEQPASKNNVLASARLNTLIKQEGAVKIEEFEDQFIEQSDADDNTHTQIALARNPRRRNRKQSLNADKKKKNNVDRKVKGRSYLGISTKDMMYKTNGDEIKCKVCLQIYFTAQNLREHFIRVHAPKNFKCPECGRCYGSKSLMHMHVIDSHTPAVCSKCGKHYNNRQSLKQHEFTHKTKLMCQKCGKHYKTPHTLRIHRCQANKTKLESVFTCDNCNKKYVRKDSLAVHMKFAHGNGKAYICPVCNKKFHATSKLKSHMVTHTQEKNFPCEICGGSFVTKASLLYHTRIHTGEKPYKCDLCEERFLSTSRKADHVRRHHLELQLNCDICGRKFKSRFSLARHQKRHDNPKSRLHHSKLSDID